MRLINQLLIGALGAVTSFSVLAKPAPAKAPAEPRAFFACAYQLNDPSRTCLQIDMPGINTNADEQLSPASLNKLMTSRLVYKHMLINHKSLDDDFVTVTQDDNAEGRKGERNGKPITDGRILDWLAGKTLTYRETIHAMAVYSANNAAEAAARIIAPDGNFSRLMNEEAKTIGMTQSNLVTASGMPATGQYTTAQDMAALIDANIALFEPRLFTELFGQTSVTIAGRKVDGHLRLLAREDKIVQAGKTGADRGGLNVAGVAQYDTVGIKFATMGSPGRAYVRDTYTQQRLRQIFEHLGVKLPELAKAAVSKAKAAPVKNFRKSRPGHLRKVAASPAD